MELRGARVLVTGGGTGIGLETARSLAAEGARLALCGRRADVLESAARETGALAVPADVSREEDVLRLFGRVQEELGGLDALVNNAAIGYRAPLVETDRERFEEVLRVNVTGAMLCGREAARLFLRQGTGGTIVNVGSTAARKGYAGGSAYAASKFALRGLSECWRAELRPHDVRVVQIDPSEVQTPFGRRPPGPENPTKLTAREVAHLIRAVLQLDDRGFVPELTLWATNPR